MIGPREDWVAQGWCGVTVDVERKGEYGCEHADRRKRSFGRFLLYYPYQIMS